MTINDVLGAVRRREGQVDQVTDDVLLARQFHLGSAIQIATPEGAVIVDTTGAVEGATRARDAIYERNRQEATYIIYTHCHGDHTGGAEPFTSDATQAIVAQSLLPSLYERDFDCLQHWTTRVRSHQMGMPVELMPGMFERPRSFVAPTMTFDESLDLEVGGLTFHLEHTEGETRDHLMVWIPERGVLMPGDLFYAAFPNLSTPAIGPRPIVGWIRSLDRFLELDAEYLVPSHTVAISGRDNVRTVLTNYRDAIQYVWDESLRAIDRGLLVHEAARAIQLPEHLASLAYLAEQYGTVNWGVRAVYDAITGWYDGDVASLNPLPRGERDAELVAAAGADAIVERAAAAHERGDHQLALELTSVVLSGEPRHRAANTVRAAACRAMLPLVTSVNERGFYASGARIAEAVLKA